MKKRILFFIGSCICLASFSQVNIQWATRYTSSGSFSDKAEDMVMDASGNIYVTGVGRGASGGFDYVTIKYDAAGVQQWKSEYNGTGNGLDEAHAIAVDASGNVYVTGWSNGGASGFDYATVKYNSAGVQQWATRYNNNNGTDEAWDVGVDNAGNVYVTGTSDGTVGASSAATSIKYNSSGVQQYANRFDGAGNGIDGCFAIYVEPVSGTFYVAGYTFRSTAQDFNFLVLKYNTAGTAQWGATGYQYNGPDSKYDEARDIAVDASGNVYVTGYSQTAVPTNYDYATVKINGTTGAAIWSSRYNGTGDDYDRANAIKLDPVGNVYVTGRSIGAGSAEDILTAKYNNGGTLKWTARYNGSSNGYDEGRAIAIDASANVYITGYSYATASNNDYTIISYDSTGAGLNGVQRWITKYNGTGNNSDQAAVIAVDNSGNVYVSGVSKGSSTNDDYATLKYCQLTANAGNDTSICIGASAPLNASAIGAVSFVWTPATGLSNTTISNPVATPTVTTTYIVSITNASSCVDDDTVVVTVVPLPAPIITASGPTSFCIGDSVMLTATKDTSYLWSNSSTTQTITVYSSGTYQVTVTNPTGCSGSASAMVTVNPLPTIDAGAYDSICIGSSTNLLASGGSTFEWHFGTTLSDSTIVNPVASPTVTTTYTVIGTSAAGCKNSDTVSIKVLSLPNIDAGLNNNVCIGSSVNIAATGGSSYVWSPGVSLSDSTIVNPVASPTVTTTYTVIGTAANGCTKKDVIKITVLQLPPIDAGLNDSICAGLSVNLQATDGISYIWQPGNTLDDSTIFDPIATPITTTTYTVVGTGINGCKNSDVVQVKVFPIPLVDAGLNDTVCKGSSINLLATGASTYVWSPSGSLVNPTTANPVATPTVTTTYTVIGTGVGGCSKSDVVKISVFIPPVVNAGTDDSMQCNGPGVQLMASGGISYIWSPSSSVNDSSIANPIATPTGTTTYTVIGTSANGCSGFDMVIVKVLSGPSIPTIYRTNDTICCNQTATSYKWYLNGSVIPGATSQCYKITQNGDYNVEVFDAVGCSSSSTTINILDISVGEINGFSLLNVYPNPTTNNLTIEFQSVKATGVKISLVNIAGQLIYSDQVNQFSGTYKKQINLQEYATGVYFLKIITNDQVINTKVIKE